MKYPHTIQLKLLRAFDKLSLFKEPLTIRVKQDAVYNPETGTNEGGSIEYTVNAYCGSATSGMYGFNTPEAFIQGFQFLAIFKKSELPESADLVSKTDLNNIEIIRKGEVFRLAKILPEPTGLFLKIVTTR